MVRVNVHPPLLGNIFLCLRCNKMFGSLVVVFPSPHKGGTLLLRHRDTSELSTQERRLRGQEQTINRSLHATFFSDIEHEVALVTSGHRITLTYYLYFDDGGPVSPNDAVLGPEYFTPPQLMMNKDAYREALTTTLKRNTCICTEARLSGQE